MPMRWARLWAISKNSGIWFASIRTCRGGFIWDWVDQSIATKGSEDITTYVVRDTKTGTEAVLSDTAAWTEGRDGTQAIENGYITVARR